MKLALALLIGSTTAMKVHQKTRKGGDDLSPEKIFKHLDADESGTVTRTELVDGTNAWWSDVQGKMLGYYDDCVAFHGADATTGLSWDEVEVCMEAHSGSGSGKGPGGSMLVKLRAKSKGDGEWDPCARPPRKEEIDWLFNAIDGTWDAEGNVTPGDGEITRAEGEAAWAAFEAEALANGWATQEELDEAAAEMDEAFTECDTSGNGTLDRKEFGKCVKDGWKEECGSPSGAGAGSLAKIFAKKR